MPPVRAGSTIRNTVVVDPGAVAELRDNLIDGVENEQPYGVRTDGGTTTLRGNTIRGQNIGLDINFGTHPTVEGDTFRPARRGHQRHRRRGSRAEVLANILGNTFCGNVTNVSAPGEVDVDLASNEVCDADLATAESGIPALAESRPRALRRTRAASRPIKPRFDLEPQEPRTPVRAGPPGHRYAKHRPVPHRATWAPRRGRGRTWAYGR